MTSASPSPASRGFVSLVGAGPGDPELLTLRAVRRLQEADLVLYDALVSPDCLALAPRAQRFQTGKRAGRPSIRQETINRLMVGAARRGRRVVRLKCGDPFVFGRGGEEALALVAAGIPFEVVPGVSTAFSAPALSGIPVTHRGLASSVVVVSGHAESAYGPVLLGLPPGSATVVVLMGLGSRERLSALMIDRGWARATPTAVLLAAGTPAARTWTGPLEALAQAPVHRDGPDAPGTIVIGAVVSLAETLSTTAENDGLALAAGQSL